MTRYAANTQLKLLFYILLIGGLLYYVQDRYGVFKLENEKVEDIEKEEESIYVEKVSGERIPIRAEIARTEEEREAGLMNRTSLEEHKGMLFVFPNDSLSGFWMKDTLIPLDMIFIDSSYKIVAILKGIQPCEESPCTVYNPEVVYRYVVEVNAGWSSKNSVGVGDTVDLGDVTSGS